MQQRNGEPQSFSRDTVLDELLDPTYDRLVEECVHQLRRELDELLQLLHGRAHSGKRCDLERLRVDVCSLLCKNISLILTTRKVEQSHRSASAAAHVHFAQYEQHPVGLLTRAPRPLHCVELNKVILIAVTNSTQNSVLTNNLSIASACVIASMSPVLSAATWSTSRTSSKTGRIARRSQMHDTTAVRVLPQSERPAATLNSVCNSKSLPMTCSKGSMYSSQPCSGRCPRQALLRSSSWRTASPSTARGLS